MNFVRRVTLTPLLCLSLAGSACPQALFENEPRTTTDLREAIFRYMFERYNYGSDVKVFCIQPERPQPERFLGRFSGDKPRVVWASDCDMTGPMNGIRQKKTGERGLRMTIMSIQRVGDGEAEAKVQAFSDGIAANWNILRVMRRDGHWIVKSDTNNGVS